MKKYINILLSGILCCLICSCSSITIDSDPQGAKVIVDGVDTGRITPAKFKVGYFRRGTHDVNVSLPGYSGRRGTFLLLKSKKRIFWTIFPPTALLAIPINLFGNRWMKVECKPGIFNLEPMPPEIMEPAPMQP